MVIPENFQATPLFITAVHYPVNSIELLLIILITAVSEKPIERFEQLPNPASQGPKKSVAITQHNSK